MATATIDELEIQIESDSNDASAAIDRLTQSLERLVNPVSTLTSSGSGLSKLSKQMEKLSASVAGIQNLTGFEKVTQAVNALKSLDSLTGAADVSSYVKAINKLAGAGASLMVIAQFPDVTAQLSSLAGALNSLQGVQGIRLDGITNSLSQLPQIVTAINGIPAIDTARIQELANSLAPLSGANASGINSFVRAVNRIPAAAQQINQIDFTQFSQNVQQLTNSLQPLVEVAERAGAGLTAISQIMQSTQRNVNSMGRLGNTLGNLSVKSLFSWASLTKLRSVLVRCFEASSQFVENLNLFNVTMGKSADTAMDFAEKVNDALGVDISDWTRYQGFFQSVGKGFGVVSEKADLMSKNLTQLTYDISSFYNVSVNDAYLKVQAGFAGELEPLRRLGFALDEATLKQVAFNHGITQSFESMTQAQKSQLRYVAMIEQAKNIGVTGDMSRTIDTAANGVRVLEARIQQFARAVGNMLMPMLSALLPYLTAFIQVVTEGANALAEMFGFELPKINLDGITNGYDDITAATEEATAATEKFKGSLAGVDQLNIIGSKNTTGGTGANQYDLNIDLPEYDFLNGVESKTKQIAEDMKQWFMDALPWIEAVGAAIGGLFIGKGISEGIIWLGKLKTAFSQFGNTLINSKNLIGLAGGLAAGASSGVLLYNSIKNLITGTGKLEDNVGQLIIGGTVATTAFLGFIALGNPLGAIITLVGALSGVVIGLAKGIEEQNNAVAGSVLYNNGGKKISEIAKAYEDWASAATKVNQETIDKYSQLDSYTQQIDELLDSMGEFADTDFDMTKLTSADAESLKEPFEQLCDYLETNFQTRAQTAADDLKSIFSNLGISGVIEEQVTQGYDKMQQMFSENLTASQTTVSTYLDKIASGGKLTDNEYAEFQKKYNYILETARNFDPEYQALSNAVAGLETIDLSKIDLENPDTVISALEQINSAADAYATSALEKFKTEQSNLNMLRRQAKTELEAENIQMPEYQEQIGLLDLSEILFAQDYENSIRELSARTQPILDAVGKMYEEAGNAVGESARQRMNEVYSHFNEQGLYIPDMTSGIDKASAGESQNWLNGNQGYQNTLSAIDHLNEMTSSINFDLKEPAYGTASYEMYKALQEGGILSTTVIANIEKTSTGSDTLDELIGTGTASGEFKIKVTPDDAIEGFIPILPRAELAAATGQSKMGYAREAIGEEYRSFTAQNDQTIEVKSGDTYVNIELDGEEVFGGYVARMANKEVLITNGR